MKKIIVVSLLLFCSILFYGCTSSESKGNYERLIGGKDTEVTFGDGRFSVDYNKKDNPYYLMDRKKEFTIDLITKYCTISPYVYAIGEKGYTKISYQLGIYHTSNLLESFDESDQAIFNLLENSFETINSYKDIYNKVQRSDDKDGPLAYIDEKGLYAVYQKKNNKYDERYELTDVKNKKVIDYITNYKLFNNCIYSIGKQGYTKFDLSITEHPYTTLKKLDNFSNEDQTVFKILENEDSIFLELNRF